MKDIVPISDSDRVYDGVRTSVGRIYSVPNQVYVQEDGTSEDEDVLNVRTEANPSGIPGIGIDVSIQGEADLYANVKDEVQANRRIAFYNKEVDKDRIKVYRKGREETNQNVPDRI